MKRPNHNDRWAKKSYSRNNPSGNHRDTQNSDLRQFAVNARSDLLELSEIHHPNCTLNRKANNVMEGNHGAGGVGGRGPGGGDQEPPQEASFHMTPETHKAIEAVRFIAAHLKNEDDYAEVGPTALKPWLKHIILFIMYTSFSNVHH